MVSFKSTAAAIIATLAICAPSNAQAFTFNYEAWNLASPEGRVAVLESLERRVDNYCRVRDARGALQRRIAQDCSARVMEQALEQLDDPRVMALHQERQRLRNATSRA